MEKIDIKTTIKTVETRLKDQQKDTKIDKSSEETLSVLCALDFVLYVYDDFLNRAFSLAVLRWWAELKNGGCISEGGGASPPVQLQRDRTQRKVCDPDAGKHHL